MKKILIPVLVIVAIVIVIIVVGGTNEVSPRPESDIDVGNTQIAATKSNVEVDPVLALTFMNYDGEEVALADFIGTPLVINSWAVWCPFCKKELPDFATVQKEFGDDVIFIAIDRQESLAVAKQYSDELGITDDMIFLLDPDDLFYKAIGAFSMPETIFLDSTGARVFHKRGPMDLTEVRERVSALVQ